MRGNSPLSLAVLLLLTFARTAGAQSGKGSPPPKAAPVTAAKATPIAPAPVARLLIVGESGGATVAASKEDAEATKTADAPAGVRPAAGAVLQAPTAAFELRFVEPVALPAPVNAVAESPLTFNPALAGTFRWTSERGGVFTPTEPPALGTTYRVTLRPGLKRPGGRPLPENALAETTFRVPAMEVVTSFGESYSAKNAGPTPKVEVLFNAAVRPDHAAEYMAFRDADGKQRVPAVVRLPGKEDYSPFRDGPDNLPRPTWRERFTGARPAPGANSAFQRLVVSPEKPLPPGKGWRLIIAHGLPAADAPGLRLPEPAEVAIGDILPFRVVSAKAIPGFDHGRRLRVTFSKDLSEGVNADTAGEFIKISPAPANLKATAEGESTVEFRGDFALDTDYRVTVAANIPAKLPFKLSEPFAATVRYTPAQARVGFPDFATHQLAGGSRTFTLWAVNAPKLRLRAKRFTPGQAVRALTTYRKDYYANVEKRQGNAVGPDGEEIAGEDSLPQFDRVDFDALPGLVTHDAPFAGPADTDHGTSFPLNWDDLLPAGRRAGIVMIEAEQPPPTAVGTKRAGSQAIVQLTDLGLVWKTAVGERGDKTVPLFVHVFSLTNADPVPGAQVRLLDADGKPLATNAATADADGLARLHLPAEREKAAWLAVEHGEDCHLVRFDPDGREGISLYRFHLPENYSGRGTAGGRQVFLFNDRGVYRPGETVHVKMIARELRPDGTLGVPAQGKGQTVALKAFDAKSRAFWTGSIPLGLNGSLSADVPLPAVASLGRYSIQAALGDEPRTGEENGGGSESDEVDDSPAATSGSVGFQVQEFQANAFDLQVTARKSYPAGAERDLRLPVHAGYLFGKPLSKARLRWTLNVSDTDFAPEGFEDYFFCTQELDYRLDRRRSDISLQGDGALSPTGDFDVVPGIAPNPKAPAPRHGEFAAEVTDIDQQTLSQRANFVLHASDFYLGLRRPGEVLREGEPLPMELVAVRAADGQPVKEPVRAEVRLTRVDWDTVRVATAGGGSTYESKARTTPVGSITLTTTPLRSLGTRWEPVADAPPAAPFVAGAPGTYLLEARTKDAAGRDVLTAGTVHVYGKGEAAWNYRSAWTMDLVPDKGEYQPGDTATVLLKTPIAGRALVTIEREGIRRTFSQRLDKASPVLRVPIEPGDAPNVFVSVMLLRGAADSPKRLKAPEYRIGYCQLAVARPEARLSVKVAATRADVRPGEPVNATAEITGHDGRPVRGAEVTLYAVDEGVLNLTGYLTPDPLGFFTRKRPLEVLTGLTLPQLHAEDAEEGNGFENKGYLVGGGGPEGARLERLRHDFPACPFWSAALITDADGRVSATFPAPDGLSGYRLMAVAHTAAGGFGGGESVFRVRKPFMVEPAMPRFGNLGDKVFARAVLHNDTPTAGEAEIGLETDERASLTGDAPFLRRVPLAAGETRAVDFPVSLLKTGRAAFALRGRFTPAKGDAMSDAVEAAFEVNHPVPRRAEVLAFKTSADHLDDLLSGGSPEILAGEDGFLEVSVTNSRLGELREGVDSLLHYPYGCVEQTTSSLLPWLALKGFEGAVLPGNAARFPEQIRRVVDKSIARLGTMQTGNGALSYWPGGTEPHPWGSAYGALGLVLAKRAGFEVPEETLTKLLDYLAQNLRDEGEKAKPGQNLHQDAGRPLALYALALAERPESAFHETLFQARADLGAEDRALLALAVLESHGPKAMADTLLREALPVRAKALPEDPFLAAINGDAWADFGNSAVANALRLLAACQGKPNERTVEPLLDTLLEAREAGHWGTTQGDAWALLAMSAYVRNVEKANGPAAGVVVAGERREAFRLMAKGETFATTLPLAARVPVSVENPGRRPIYVHVKLSSRPKSAPTARRDAGYTLRRTYQRLADDGAVSPAENLRVGERVLVSLELDASRRASYLAVDDPLPAVLEAINPEFKTATAVGAGPAGGTFLPWAVSFRELRADRALFFIDRLSSPGRYHLSYVARVRAAGEVTAPAATVSEMYHPERAGATAAGTMTAAAME